MASSCSRNRSASACALTPRRVCDLDALLGALPRRYARGGNLAAAAADFLEHRSLFLAREQERRGRLMRSAHPYVQALLV